MDIIPEIYQSPFRDWVYTDYRQGVVYFFARNGRYLAMGMQEWMSKHPDDFGRLKAMTTHRATHEEFHAFILYVPPNAMPLMERMDLDMVNFEAEEPAGPAMDVIHDV